MKRKIAKATAVFLASIALCYLPTKSQGAFCPGRGDYVLSGGVMVFYCGTGLGSTACWYPCNKE